MQAPTAHERVKVVGRPETLALALALAQMSVATHAIAPSTAGADGDRGAAQRPSLSVRRAPPSPILRIAARAITASKTYQRQIPTILPRRHERTPDWAGPRDAHFASRGQRLPSDGGERNEL
jgi:hypothetical protein